MEIFTYNGRIYAQRGRKHLPRESEDVTMQCIAAVRDLMMEIIGDCEQTNTVFMQWPHERGRVVLRVSVEEADYATGAE